MGGDYSQDDRLLTWTIEAPMKTQGENIIFPGGVVTPITAPASADFALDDFTIELFGVTFVANNVRTGLIGFYNPASNQRSWFVEFRGDLDPKILSMVLSTDGTSGTALQKDSTEFIPSLDTPYDLCVDRSGDTLRFYVDGVMFGSQTYAGTTFNSNAPLSIGRGAPANASHNGKMQAVRITRAARYASDGGYSPPPLPLPTQA